MKPVVLVRVGFLCVVPFLVAAQCCPSGQSLYESCSSGSATTLTIEPGQSAYVNGDQAGKTVALAPVHLWGDCNFTSGTVTTFKLGTTPPAIDQTYQITSSGLGFGVNGAAPLVSQGAIQIKNGTGVRVTVAAQVDQCGFICLATAPPPPPVVISQPSAGCATGTGGVSGGSGGASGGAPGSGATAGTGGGPPNCTAEAQGGLIYCPPGACSASAHSAGWERSGTAVCSYQPGSDGKCLCDLPDVPADCKGCSCYTAADSQGKPVAPVLCSDGG